MDEYMEYIRTYKAYINIFLYMIVKDVVLRSTDYLSKNRLRVILHLWKIYIYDLTSWRRLLSQRAVEKRVEINNALMNPHNRLMSFINREGAGDSHDKHKSAATPTSLSSEAGSIVDTSSIQIQTQRSEDHLDYMGRLRLYSKYQYR